MNRYIGFFLAALALPLSALANTTEYEGDSSYEFHLGPPTLSISGDSAKQLMKDMRFSDAEKKVTVTVYCQDNAGSSNPASCTIQFPKR